MKKQKQPGENFSLKTKKTELPAIMDWINAQTNLMDSFRYLIENDIRMYGIRNLQQVIPADRGPLLVEAHGGRAPIERAADAVGLPQGEAGIGEAAAEDAASQAVEAGRKPQDRAVRSPEPSVPAQPEEDIDEEDIQSWL